MLVKIITFFLIAMAVLAMFGRLRLRGPGRSARRDGLPPKPGRCSDCGGYVIGAGPCACKGTGGRP